MALGREYLHSMAEAEGLEFIKTCRAAADTGDHVAARWALEWGRENSSVGTPLVIKNRWNYVAISADI